MAIVSCKDLGTDARVLLVDHDPLTVATDAPKGSLIINANGTWYRKKDDGATTNVTVYSGDVATYGDLPGTGVTKQVILVADTSTQHVWDGSKWVQTGVSQKRLDGIIVSKFGSSAPTEYKHGSGNGVTTYERFQSGKDNSAGAGFAGASREWIAGDGGDGGGGDFDGGPGGELLVRPGAGGALAGTGSDGAVGNFVVWDGTTKFFKVRRDGLTTIQRTDLKAVSTDGLVLENPTAATVGEPVQISPRLRFRGHARDTDPGSSESADWIIENVPASATTITASLNFLCSISGAAYVNRFQFGSNGQASGNTFYATGNMQSPLLTALGNDATITLQNRAFSNSDSAIEAVSGTMTQGDGETFVGMMIRPTYTQSGTAGATDFVVSRKENSVGTGPQLLMDLGTCTTAGDYSTHVSRFKVDNTGSVYATGNIRLTSGGSIITSSNGNLTLAPNGYGNVINTLSMTQATGDEKAFQINYTTNKLTSGNDYGLYINQTDTASPGTSYLLWAGVGATFKFYVRNDGYAEFADSVKTFGSFSGNTLTATANNQTVAIQHRAFTAAKSAIEMATGAWTHSTGEGVAVCIKPTWNSSGDASQTCLKIDSTSTTVGSGGYYFISAYDDTSQKFYVSSTGGLGLWGNLTFTGGGTIVTTSNGNITMAPNGTGIVIVDAAELKMKSGKKLSLGDGGAATDYSAYFNGINVYADLKTGAYYNQHGAVTKWIWNATELFLLNNVYFALGTGGYAADWYAKYDDTNCEMKIVNGEWRFFGGASEVYVINSTGQHGWFGKAPASQQAHIADPTGGGTVDTEARAAIAACLLALENYGLLAAA